jgi:NTP pyrophosphatase (non-canonical NTP hydrolase)
MSKSINEWSREIGAWGERKGWDKPPLCEAKAYDRGATAKIEPEGVDTNAVLAKIALCHTELAEATEAARDGKYVAYLDEEGKPQGVATELADTMIRIMHLADLLGLDLEATVEQKQAFNEGREYRHGGRLA